MRKLIVASIIGAAIVVGGVIAYRARDGGHGDTGSPTPTPTTMAEPDSFERRASEFVAAIASGDVERYRSMWYPDTRPTVEQSIRAFRNSPDDVGGCDALGAEFVMTEGNGGVYVDVTFSKPCGELGTTGGCNVYFRRRDAAWWVEQWNCSMVNATGTPFERRDR